MPGRHRRRRALGLDYAPLFRRIEEAFDPSELDTRTLKDYINASTPGMVGLAEQISQTKIISDMIESSISINELRELRKEVRKLKVHGFRLSERIQERIIALSVTIGEGLAREKRIRFTEDITSNIEVWKDGKERIVIRKKGSFRGWRLV